MILSRPLRACALATLLATGCDDEPGQGAVTVTAYGEDFIEEGVPAEAMADGWAVTFDAFVVTLRDVEVGGATLVAPEPVDLTQPSGGQGQVLGTLTVPAGQHRRPAFTVARVEVSGQAHKGEASRTFSWIFDQPTRYAGCDTVTRVPAGGEATFQVTIHADHLFYDSLVAEAPDLRFEALAAADADGDGVITRAELEAASVGAYDVGNADVDTLWGFLAAQVRTLGHVDGEGHCDATAPTP